MFKMVLTIAIEISGYKILLIKYFLPTSMFDLLYIDLVGTIFNSYSANQWIGFNMIMTSVMKELKETKSRGESS